MITRDTDVIVEFTCQPITAGYSTGDHVCTWRFSGSSEVLTGTTVSHTWTTGGIHRATVTAVNAAAGTSATASIPLLIVKQPSVLDPLYILIEHSARALTRSEIYYLDGTDIHLWDPDAETDSIFTTLPAVVWEGLTDEAPTFQGWEVSEGYLHAHYLGWFTYPPNYSYSPPTSATSVLLSYRRRLDLSDVWTLYGDFRCRHWGMSAWDVFYPPLPALTFADGRTWAIGYEYNIPGPPSSGIEGWDNRITGEAGMDHNLLSAAHGLYYASLDRAWIATEYDNAEVQKTWISTADRAQNVYIRYGASVNQFEAGSRWFFYQDGETLHVTNVSGAETTKPSCVMAAEFHPIPFESKSLLILDSDAASGANAVWWTGTEFVEEFLGDTDRSSLVPKLFSPGLVFARTGEMYSLADGSLLHCLV